MENKIKKTTIFRSMNKHLFSDFYDMIEENGYKKYQRYGFEYYINMWDKIFIMEYTTSELVDRNSLMSCVIKYPDIKSKDNIAAQLYMHGMGYLNGNHNHVLYDGPSENLKTFFRKNKIEKIVSK